jgi:hypothetical protein
VACYKIHKLPFVPTECDPICGSVWMTKHIREHSTCPHSSSFILGNTKVRCHRLKPLNQFRNPGCYINRKSEWHCLMPVTELGGTSLYVLQYCEKFMINLIRISSMLLGWLRFSFSHWITKILYISKGKQRRSASYHFAHTLNHYLMWYRECSSICTAIHKTDKHYILLLWESTTICKQIITVFCGYRVKDYSLDLKISSKMSHRLLLQTSVTQAIMLLQKQMTCSLVNLKHILKNKNIWLHAIQNVIKCYQSVGEKKSTSCSWSNPTSAVQWRVISSTYTDTTCYRYHASLFLPSQNYSCMLEEYVYLQH